MDKKRGAKPLLPEDLKGFEEFLEGQPNDANFLPRPGKKEAFEHFTFLTNDSIRLNKLKNLLTEKLAFTLRFSQSQKILTDQEEELTLLRKRIKDISHLSDSPFRKSMREVFDAFFEPAKD